MLYIRPSVRQLFTTTIGIASLLLFPLNVLAQEVPRPDTSYTGHTHKLSLPELPNLETILQYATQNSPEIRRQEAIVEGSKNSVIEARRDWMSGVTFGAEATYGTFDESQIVDRNRNPRFTEEFLFNTRLRVGVDISLFDIFGRDSRINIERAQLRADQFQRDAVRKDLESELINIYYDILESRKLVEVRSQDYRSTQAHLEFVQTSFQQGSIQVSEVSRVTQFATDAESQFQEARINYLRRYRLLENLLGVENLETLTGNTTTPR